MSPILQHRSLPESVHEILRGQILNDSIPAGTALVELALAEEFGVSRTTIRTALLGLQAERLVEISPRRGTTVTRMSPEASEELCVARYALEAVHLGEVLNTARTSLVTEMSAAIEQMTRAADEQDAVGVIEADTVLHRAIMEAGGNRLLTDMWESLNGQMGALMRSTFDRKGIDLAETVRWHERLVRAFRRKEPAGAVVALHDHYLSGAVSKIRHVAARETQ